MNYQHYVKHAFIVGMLVGAGAFNSGCASIVHGGQRSISVATEPQGAKATITKAGEPETISVHTTPFTVKLDPKRGYFKGQSYNIALELPGYKSADVLLEPKISGWFFGNILLGGLIGMLVVDPLTGSMWNLTPEKIERKLTADQTTLLKSGDGFLVILMSEASEREKARMVRIN